MAAALDWLRRLRLRRAPAFLAPAQALPAAAALGRDFPDWQPLFARRGRFVDAGHAAIAALPMDGALIRGPVPGYLRPADALALYELAFHATGDVLELGAAWGLSTTFLCRAVRASGRGAEVVSVEIDPGFQAAASRAAAGLGARHAMIAGDAALVLPRLVAEGRRFGFVFVDHDHGADATRAVAAVLPRLIPPGGWALFHDLNDARNGEPGSGYGVHAGVHGLLSGAAFSYRGTIGCCGLLRREPE